MPEMPNDPEFGRFIEGLKDIPEEGIEVDLPPEDAEVEELPDGSAVVNLSDFNGPNENEDFYANLAETYDAFELSKVAMRYLQLIGKDKEARKERDKQYEEGLKRTGLGNDAPGGAQFQGASKVVHPIMAEACVDFASRAMKEMFPPDGPTRTKILGEVTEDKTETAERKRDYMNWQLTEQIEEFRDEQEQLLTQLPLGGSQFLKLWYDDSKRRPCAEFVPIDNILLPFAATNFYTAQRATEMQDITEWEFQQRIDRGLYRDVNLIRATMEPEQTAAEKANDKIEGKQYQDGSDGLRRVYHIYTWLSLEEDSYSKGENAPYILMIDEMENEVIGLYRNWEEGDATMTKLDWIVEFKFIPWRGAYAIGLPHLIGGLSAALTGALRALLDTAHINNSATMLKIKGAKISGQSQNVEVTQVTEIEGAPGVDDVRKIAMPMPFNPPSQVLYELLGWLTSAAKGVVTTAEEKIADVKTGTPVGTTQALIEQGAAVFSSIHARLHDSQARVLKILGRINRWYLDEQRRGDVVAELPIRRDDFKRNSDVVPVSDPHIFSETQRISQMQAVLQMAEKYPQIFDQRAVVARMLKQLKIPNVNELIPNAAKPEEMNAADENSAMALGRPAFAYPRQDHLAHIQAHLNFALDPNLGSNRLIAPKYVPQVLEHIKQHMMLWYTNQMSQYVQGGTNMRFDKYENNKLVKQVDQAIALASDHVKLDTQDVFSGVLPALQQLSQTLMELQKSMQAPPPMDGEAQAVLQASLAETQRRAARDQADTQIDTARLQAENARKEKELQIKVAMNAENNLTKERMKAADLTVDEAKLQREQSETAIKLNESTQRRLGG
jgi:chaperonin GroES